ncbi:MAG TPA: methyltransferase domain-containing protein [Saprospiraceae bacterium]|nr:methyltransferase domain-containing protein [Saprospiraceae bacterium]HPI06825.1 methyltransferase domain-containing protein [Saprospiraceae bacterium]
MPTNLSADFWETRWQNDETHWDLNTVSPPLAAYIDQIPAEKRNLRILIPGCGNGHEALYLLQKGFTQVTMLDIAPTAVAQLQQRLNMEMPGWQTALRLVCADFFQHDDNYDLILEQTFFCALPPDMRPAYVLKMNALLRPGGKLAGLLFNREFEGGPPFGGDKAEYLALFAPHFRIATMAPSINSVAPRAGSELFFILEKEKIN